MIPSFMPPIWLDEHSHRVPTRKCARPGCGREYPVRRYRYDTLRLIGWPLYRVARFTSWCGHGQELIPCRMKGSGCSSYRSSEQLDRGRAVTWALAARSDAPVLCVDL